MTARTSSLQDPVEAQRRLEASFRGRGLDIDPEQETKTRIVLQHFAAAAGSR